MNRFRAPLLLTVVALALAGLATCASCVHQPTSPQSEAESPDKDNVALAVEIGLSAGTAAAMAAQWQAVEQQDAGGCVAASVAIGGIGLSQQIWRQANSSLPGAQIALGSITVDASPCLPLGLPAIEWDASASALVKQAAETTSMALQLAERSICTAQPDTQQCLGLSVAAEVGRSFGVIYGATAEALNNESIAQDGLVVVDLGLLQLPIGGGRDDDDDNDSAWLDEPPLRRQMRWSTARQGDQLRSPSPSWRTCGSWS